MTQEKKIKCLSQSNTTSRTLLLQVHPVTPSAARHTPACPEQRHPQRFPHLKLTLFYYCQCGLANICNPSTSVKCLYHSTAKIQGKQYFPLALHRPSQGDVHSREPSACPGGISLLQTPSMAFHCYKVKKTQELSLGRYGGRHMPECPSARWEVQAEEA